MDVVCDRCQTEYEFDDALVSERGTTVKCTTCGHQFKIYRKGAQKGTGWQLRRVDGSITNFESLAVLQRWITEGAVHRSDELSRDGREWKPLGAIAELDGFFASADSRNTTAQKPAVQQRAATTNPAGPKLPAIPAPPPPRPPLKTAPQGTPAPNSPQGFSLGESGGGEARYDFGDDTGVLDKWGPNKGDKKKAGPAVGPPPVSSGELPAAAPPKKHFIPDATVRLPPIEQRSRGSRGVLIGLAIGASLTLGGVLAGWRVGAFHSGPDTSQVQDRIAIAVVRAELAARGADRASYDEARDVLTALLATEPDEPRLRAARAQVLALSGEQVRRRAADLEAKAERVPAEAVALRAEANVVRRDISPILERARQDLRAAESNATRVPAGNERVRFERALAETARVLEDAEVARRHLAAARAAGASPETDLAELLLAPLSTDEAITRLRALTTNEATALRARLLLARVLAERGDAAGARSELAAILAVRSAHEEALALQQAITAGLPPLRIAAQATPDAGAPAGPRTPPSSGGNTTNSGNSGGNSGGTPSYAGRSYDSLIEEGERLLERGQRERARAAFNAALAARANGAEALTGLGFLDLDAGNASGAISQFRRAQAINARYSDVYIGLGEAYSRQGNLQQALRSFREYLDVNPGGSRSSMAQHQIEVLERRIGAATQTNNENPSPPPANPAPSGGTETPPAANNGGQ